MELRGEDNCLNTIKRIKMIDRIKKVAHGPGHCPRIA
jgi:hypothetical protein